MDELTLEVDWDVPPKNGLNEFISADLYIEQSVTYKILKENVCNYYAKFLKKNEARVTEEPYNEKGDSEVQKQKPAISRPNKKEGKLRTNAFDKQTSSLTAREQKKYLFLFQKYGNEVVSVNTTEEEKKAIETLMVLHKKVVEEQKKFAEYQKSSTKSHKDYNFVHPEAARYVKELVQKKLQSCISYPRHYVIKQKLSLLEDVKIDSSVLPSLVCNLLELGRVPKLISPDLENCTIPCNYAKMCRRFSFNISSDTSDKHPSKQPISQDSIAKTLADKHSADVVVSFSGLKHLLNCRSLDSNTSWELPVTVASFSSTDDGTECCAKRVLIDKAIPAGTWLSLRKNAVYHKYGVKLQFTHFKPSKANRKTRSFYQQIDGGKQQDRELVELQDGFFETEDFLHETFGQISGSTEKKTLIDKGSTESEVKTVDSTHKSTENEKFSQRKDNENNLTVASEVESLLNNLNNTVKEHFDNDKSNTVSSYKENELAAKNANIVSKGCADNSIENKCYRRISFVAASCQSNNNEDISKNKSSPDSSMCGSLEQIKRSPNNKQNTSDDFDESPKGKKRKAKFEPSASLPGRRVTRSQTKKLEDTVKQSSPCKTCNFEEKTQCRKEINKTKQNTTSQLETTVESLPQVKEDNDQNSDKAIQQIEDFKAVQENKVLNNEKENVNKETVPFESETSTDSFPRLVSKKIKLLSSDDDESDDNLVIDENVLSADEKLKGKISDVSKRSNIDVNVLTDEEPICSDKSELQNKRTNIQDISNKNNVIQPVATDGTLNDNKQLSSGDKKESEAPLDHILQLQSKLKNSFTSKPKTCTSPEQGLRVSSGPQPGLPTYLEDASQFPSLDPSLNINTQYSLWNMGPLKVIMRSRLDSRQLNSIPCFIFPKLEYQSQFGGETCSKQELLYQWITLLCHPGSVGLRVRIDARTSKVLMVEELTLPKMHNLVAELSPEKPLCWISDVFEKLRGLPDGNYLLAYRKREDIVTLYAATEGNKRGDFDLHTAIRQRLVALDDDNTGWNVNESETEDIPWLPVDPVVMLPSLVRRSRIPAMFPPAKGNEPMSKEKKKNSKKKSKKKSKISKMKAKLRKS